MLCTAWPHVSPVAFAGVRAIVGRRAGIMRGSWHGPARTCVRRGGHGRLAFDPFCPPSWPGTQCTSQQGVVQHCDPVPSMACSAVQGRGSSAEDASRHCLLCRQAGGGRECGGVRLVVRRSAGRQASVASVGRRTSSHVVGVLGWGAVDWSSDTNCLLVGGFEQAPDSERFGFSSVLLL